MLVLLVSSASAQKFRRDDPIQRDPDMSVIPMPKELDDISMYVDFLSNTFSHHPDAHIPPAVNTNTLGEVPDSSWFTNRISLHDLSLDEVVRGPNTGAGPDMTKPWTIIAAKSQGITPGFTITDGRGDTYFIKFDPSRYPGLATSSEVVVTKFFYAFGYNVPTNYLARISRDKVVVGPNAKIRDESGVKRPMTEKDVDRIFERVPVAEDETVQVVASFAIKGRVVGPFKYLGTRPDDPNDIFPHEHRRELRGLRLFAAWLNHDDSRSINTKDFYEGPDGQGFVRHYLIDFGSCLGSGSVRPQGRRAGNEYMFEWGPTLRSALTLGIWDRSWRYTKYPDYPEIGRFEGDAFKPDQWRPEYPNAAFERMIDGDAFWACRIIAKFTDEMVRGLVSTGEWKDPAAEQYLVQTLLKRRDKILGHYLGQLNPITDFAVVERNGRAILTYANLGEKLGLGKAETYDYQWSSFENGANSASALGPVEIVGLPELEIPASASPYLLVRIKSHSPAHPGWQKPVSVYLTGSPRRVVGIERD